MVSGETGLPSPLLVIFFSGAGNGQWGDWYDIFTRYNVLFTGADGQ